MGGAITRCITGNPVFRTYTGSDAVIRRLDQNEYRDRINLLREGNNTLKVRVPINQNICNETTFDFGNIALFHNTEYTIPEDWNLGDSIRYCDTISTRGDNSRIEEVRLRQW